MELWHVRALHPAAARLVRKFRVWWRLPRKDMEEAIRQLGAPTPGPGELPHEAG